VKAVPYLLFGTLPLIIVVSPWAAFHARTKGPAQETVSEEDSLSGRACCAARIDVPEDPAALASLKGEFARRQAAVQAAASEENRLRVTQWRGCRFVPSARPENAAEHERQKAVAEQFTAKQQVPGRRVEAFRFATGNPDILLVGWTARVLNVTESKDGKRVELDVSPEMVTSGGALATTPHRCRETWTIGQDGALSIEKIEPIAGSARFVLVL
jgi:hypothetical protein